MPERCQRLRVLHSMRHGTKCNCSCCAQGLEKGFQVELPDIWLENGNPWELKRQGIKYPVGFYGEVKDGKWVPSEKVGPL